MRKIQHPDINDDQIRFILPHPDAPINANRRSRKIWPVIVFGLLVLAIALVAYIAFRANSTDEEISVKAVGTTSVSVRTLSNDSAVGGADKAYTAVQDTIVDGTKLTILTPIGGRPELAIGGETLNDTTALLIVQAADVRGDNGEIVGAFVLKGNLLSTGRSKAGFCAIIGGAITVGVADTTPFLEQALDSGGDFFRQYPLVVGSQVVENKPKGKSYRKALAELAGQMVVIMSCDKMTFHDFSQALVDLGVTNAIYLVGSTAYGFARVEDGSIVTFGEKVENSPEHVSYIVWRDERKQLGRK